VDTAWGSNNDVDASLLQLGDVILDDGTANTGVDLDAHVLSDGVHDVGDLHGELTGG